MFQKTLKKLYSVPVPRLQYRKPVPKNRPGTAFSSCEVMDNQKGHLSFAHKEYHLNYSKVLCSKFGKVRSLNVWVSVTNSGLFKMEY